MKGKKSCTVLIFLGALLVAVFGIGLAIRQNPGILARRYYYDLPLERFQDFCAAWWLPAGIVGIPMLIISLIVSLVREKKNSK